jgi:DNA-binding SARP family transcriptional activator
MLLQREQVLQFRILGPLEVVSDGRALSLGGRNQRALLALLLLRAGQPVSVERLVDDLWGEHPPRTATTSLQNAVVQLRKLLGPELVRTTPAGYVLELAGHDLDLRRFEQLVREASAAAPAERAALLRDALGLWRGPPLADLELEEFAQPEIRRLKGVRLGVVEDRIAAELEAGTAAAELAVELEALTSRHPRRERLRAQLMLAHYRAGRQADALAVYHDARRTLVEELGIEPGPELQRLYRGILRQERSLAPAPAPTLDDHYDDVARALWSGRLVPVLGPDTAALGTADLVELLTERFGLDASDRGLAYVCQTIAAQNGTGPLYDELHDALRGEAEPTALQRWLARTPALLRSRGLPQLLVVSTGFDGGLEQAFAECGEPLDVVAYLASGRHRGKFLHVPPESEPTVIVEPNAYTGLDLGERAVLLKIHGQLDTTDTRERESFAVSEDDHIDYLVGGDAPATVPVQVAARLRRSHLLFVGYGVHDWSLRVFLRRVWGGDRLAYRSWAVQSECRHVGRELWVERGVDVYETSLADYVERLEQLLEPPEGASA